MTWTASYLNREWGWPLDQAEQFIAALRTYEKIKPTPRRYCDCCHYPALTLAAATALDAEGYTYSPPVVSTNGLCEECTTAELFDYRPDNW